MQEVDVQRVALDPLTAVQQPAQRRHRVADFDAASVLHRQARRHLVGDGADPADPRRDVGGFAEVPAHEHRLEEARWLEDIQRDVADASVAHDDAQRALALDASDALSADRACGAVTHWRTPEETRGGPRVTAVVA